MPPESDDALSQFVSEATSRHRVSFADEATRDGHSRAERRRTMVRAASAAELRPAPPQQQQQDKLPAGTNADGTGTGSGGNIYRASSHPELRRAAACVRELSQGEIVQRSRSAAEFFEEAQNINAKARPPEETEALLAAMRERKTSKDNTKLERKPSERALVTRKRIAERSSTMARLASEVVVEPVLPSPAEPEPSPTKKPSLMEKFGYGIKPKIEKKLVTTGQEQAPLLRRQSSMMGIEVGKNDLKERLARRKQEQNSI